MSPFPSKAEMASTFKYTSLELVQLRLLILSPGCNQDELYGSLLVAELEPERGVIPRYEAISYAWGDQSNPDQITIHPPDTAPDMPRASNDNNASSNVIAIGRNLGAALRRLRSATESRVLWCDSICIDQQNLDERAAQVRLMGKIFTHAQRVIAWLGPESDQSHLAVQTLVELASYIDFTNEEQDLLLDKLQLKNANSDTVKTILDPEKPFPISPQQWKSLEALLSRSWFRRLWVRQEIALAGKETLAVVGNDEIPWIHLSGAIELISSKNLTSGMFATILSIDFTNVRTFSFMRHLRDFPSLAGFTYSCEATDPRDLVYGLLGFTSGAFTSEVPIDYKRDVKDVYRDALVRVSYWHQNLTLMSFCDSASAPTWVPDFDRVRNMRPMIAGQAALASPNSARALSRTLAEFDGIQSDVVSEVLGPIPGDDDSEEQRKDIVIKAAVRYLGSDPTVWSQGKVKQFCLALLVRYQFIQPPYLARLKACLATFVSSGGNDASRPDFAVQILTFTTYLFRRSLYMTERGYIMLGPRNCQPGDLVCVFLGSNLPSVLHPVGNGEHHMRGPACHPALYLGEAILGELPEGWMLRHPARVRKPHFESSDGSQQYIDPRLSDVPLPSDWELRKRQDGTPFWYSAERDRWTTLDPRLSKEQLQERGIKIETFTVT
ncbi:Heterokaryon incompatibility protein [Paramyrothecium foliicola]|nr:Heterokaryon incompatibility protein [Paramyrothecium foliicola]